MKYGLGQSKDNKLIMWYAREFEIITKRGVEVVVVVAVMSGNAAFTAVYNPVLIYTTAWFLHQKISYTQKQEHEQYHKNDAGYRSTFEESP